MTEAQKDEWLDKHRTLEVAREAGRSSALEIFQLAGLNLSDADSINNVQQDFAHVRRHRLAQEVIKRQTLKVAISVIMLGALGMLWLGIKDSIPGVK